jgi:hypothetical protein
MGSLGALIVAASQRGTVVLPEVELGEVAL